MKAVPTDPSIDKEFLRFYLKRDELLHHLEAFQQRTVGQAGIEMNELKNYPIPVPTLEQQQEFVAFVQQSDKSKFAALNVSNLNLSRSLEILSEMRRVGI
jgi:type I restriction enzyme S subunit